MKPTSIEDFYGEIRENIPENIYRELGHFNVFRLEDLFDETKRNHIMPYNRRSYYKISLIKGRYRAEYADKTIEIKKNALLFATPKIPYNWIALEGSQAGCFCIFTEEFLFNVGISADNFPIFLPGGVPVFEISEEQVNEIAPIFDKMESEINSGYAFKYDLIRNYVIELIHYGQKLQPTAIEPYPVPNAASRVFALFIELLERQFPIESPHQKLALRNAQSYAGRLAIHVNYLNRVVKEASGFTTTALINERVLQEAKILLKKSDWNVSEISYSLGFEEIAHFSNFFKKHTSINPLEYRKVN